MAPLHEALSSVDQVSSRLAVAAKPLTRRELQVIVLICDGRTTKRESAKRDQFDRWREEFDTYERAHPTQWGRGPSTCSEPGCHKPVRGRGLCRSHYYRATGY